MNRRRRQLVVAAVALACAGAAAAYDLDEIRKRGVVRIAVYKQFAPFHDKGEGVDVDVAQALAAALRVKAALLPFDADENIDDDLRNMVWRGHYLGYGPADVMLHVPVDPALSARNTRVTIVAPYYREKLQIARDVKRIPQLASLSALAGMPVGVEDATLGSTVLLGADGGRLRENVRHYRNTSLAVEELKKGALAAVVGLRSELMAGALVGNGFEMTDIPAPGVPASGWALGVAVKKDYEALAHAVDEAMGQLIKSGQIEAIFRKHRVDWLQP
jgi:ABC-type amino acid transport substrate-binding protein